MVLNKLLPRRQGKSKNDDHEEDAISLGTIGSRKSKKNKKSRWIMKKIKKVTNRTTKSNSSPMGKEEEMEETLQLSFADDKTRANFSLSLDLRELESHETPSTDTPPSTDSNNIDESEKLDVTNGGDDQSYANADDQSNATAVDDDDDDGDDVDDNDDNDVDDNDDQSATPGPPFSSSSISKDDMEGKQICNLAESLFQEKDRLARRRSLLEARRNSFSSLYGTESTITDDNTGNNEHQQTQKNFHSSLPDFSSGTPAWIAREPPKQEVLSTTTDDNNNEDQQTQKNFHSSLPDFSSGNPAWVAHEPPKQEVSSTTADDNNNEHHQQTQKNFHSSLPDFSSGTPAWIAREPPKQEVSSSSDDKSIYSISSHHTSASVNIQFDSLPGNVQEQLYYRAVQRKREELRRKRDSVTRQLQALDRLTSQFHSQYQDSPPNPREVGQGEEYPPIDLHVPIYSNDLSRGHQTQASDGSQHQANERRAFRRFSDQGNCYPAAPYSVSGMPPASYQGSPKVLSPRRVSYPQRQNPQNYSPYQSSASSVSGAPSQQAYRHHGSDRSCCSAHVGGNRNYPQHQNPLQGFVVQTSNRGHSKQPPTYHDNFHHHHQRHEDPMRPPFSMISCKKRNRVPPPAPNSHFVPVTLPPSPPPFTDGLLAPPPPPLSTPTKSCDTDATPRTVNRKIIVDQAAEIKSLREHLDKKQQAQLPGEQYHGYNNSSRYDDRSVGSYSQHSRHHVSFDNNSVSEHSRSTINSMWTDNRSVTSDFSCSESILHNTMVSKADLKRKHYLEEADDEVNCLHLAILQGNEELIRQIVYYRPCLANKTSRRGDTPLHYAIKFLSEQKREDICRILLKACPKAVFKRTKKYGLFPPRMTPLEIAMQCHGGPKLFDLLLEFTTAYEKKKEEKEQQQKK